MSQKDLHQPMVILAAAGSGATLLTKTLSAHSAVVVVDDCGLCRDLMVLLDLLQSTSDDASTSAAHVVASAGAGAEAALSQPSDAARIAGAARAAALSEFSSYASAPRSPEELFGFARRLIENAAANDGA